MGVIDMKMNSSRAVAHDAIRRRRVISQSSSLKQSQTSSPLSKKRRLQLSPPTTNDISQSLSSTPTQTPSSTNCRRCSSPSKLISVEKHRPPRHPDSPIPTSSSSLCDTIPIEFLCSRHDMLNDYKNEKYPTELLARIEKKNSYTKIDDNEQRDEKEDEHRSVASNDTFCLSIDTGDEKDMKNISSKTKEESSNVKVSEVPEQKKDSVLDFFKRLPSTLIKRRREEKDSNVNDASVSCKVGVVSPICEDEMLDEEQQQRVVSNDTFRLLLSRSQEEEEAFDDVSDSLHLKSESSESELQKKVFPQTFECLDIWP